ncbi:NEW3 domain-containing protein [Pelomicrobium methylotrophicum]|nr:NEW3 domain-containing protein [Pelomicrobium methylotrophicum]
MERMGVLLTLLLLFVSTPALAAQERAYRGLALSTPYPAQSLRPAETLAIPLSVHNFGLPPQVVQLRVERVPEGWRASFVGDGRAIDAVYVNPDTERSVTLRLDPPKKLGKGSYSLLLVAQGAAHRAELPLRLQFGEVLPADIGLKASLPTLQGSASATFSYELTIENRSGQDALVNLSADAPPGFEVSFTPAFSSQQVTSLPVKAGESRDFNVRVQPPRRATADRYRIVVHADTGRARAATELTVVVVGRPQLALRTPSGVLSGDAYAGEATPVTLLVENTGTAPARGVALSALAPNEWKVTFDPKELAAVPAGERVQVTATLTPSPRSLAGDFNVTIRADAEGESASMDYRVTVRTSTWWGLVGIAVVAAALGVVGFAVARYGRR